uniref:glycerol-3-phosphate dehydrogenase, mitochondrial isoform X2 n=1 Tax=Myxine glutinosa TaxID=7769 RepID=UPI00358E1AF5
MVLFKVLSGVVLASSGALMTVAGLSGIAKYQQRKRRENKKHVTALERQKERAEPAMLPSRAAQLLTLHSTKEFDVLVVGGGATGSGCALDAVTRGLKTALVEKNDFSSGTSSRSTKLIHGGVRYLQKAFMNFDIEQYYMVKEALHERSNLLMIAPHLSSALPIMLPVYKWWQLPYYWIGIKMYDLIAGSQCLRSSYLLSKARALELFPMLNRDKLVGAIVYYDGQHNDARMNLAIVLSAARYGAAVANHTEVLRLLKQHDPKTNVERVRGAHCRDNLTGEEFDILSKCVINATGPFTDSLRKMDDPKMKNICQPSAGVHVIMPGYYSPDNMGLLDPATSDGRVIFFLPWERMTVAGTTDTPTEVTDHPSPREEDIQFIINEVRNYLSPDVEVRRGDVLAAWSGIRPLVTDPDSKDTQSICRNHLVSVSKSGLVTIAGGKWTTYRSMAEETIDRAVAEHKLLVTGPCCTVGLLLDGADDWTPTLHIRLTQDYGLEPEVAKHLASTYGDKAISIAKMSKVTGKRWPIVGKRLVSEFPYIESEARYAVQEYACTAIDVLARRTRLAFLHVQAADEALPRIVDILAQELGWNSKRKKTELDAAREFLFHEMGYRVRSEQLNDSEINLSPADIDRCKKRFLKFDQDNKGFITTLDVQRVLESTGDGIDEDSLHEILSEVDLNKNGQVELNEFLKLMSAIKMGSVSGSRFATLMKIAEQSTSDSARSTIPVGRSGGGV